MVDDNVKAVVSNDGFEYEVEFGEINKNRKCCGRGQIDVKIKSRHSPSVQFKGFSKNNEAENVKFKLLTKGQFCPLCGSSIRVKAKYNVETMFYNWRNATKDIDEAVRKAWLSLRK